MADTPTGGERSPEYNRGWAEGHSTAMDDCNPVIDRLQRALRVASHSPHDRDGAPDDASGFSTCSSCGAILIDAERARPDALREALPALADRWLAEVTMALPDGTEPLPIVSLNVRAFAVWAAAVDTNRQRESVNRALSEALATPMYPWLDEYGPAKAWEVAMDLVRAALADGGER